MILALMTAPRSSALLTASIFPIAGINIGACIDVGTWLSDMCWAADRG